MAFVYRTRSTEDNDERSRQAGGNFISYLKSEYRIFQPVRGENCIRIMPASNRWQTKWYGLDVWVHYGVGLDRGSVICLWKGVPKLGRTGERCPICYEQQRAKSAGDEALARELRPVQRVVLFLLDRKDESKGVLIWGMPTTLDQMILKATRSRENGTYKEVDSPEKGFDVYFDVGGGDGILRKYEAVALAAGPSRVSPKWVDFVDDNPIPDCLVFRSYEEVKKLFDGMADADDEDERHRDRGFREAGNGHSGYSERPGREPSREEYHRRSSSRDEESERYASDERPPREEESRDEPPWQDNPPREEPEAERAPERESRRSEEPIRRPRGNGDDRAAPPDAGKTRADELKARFLSGGRK